MGIIVFCIYKDAHCFLLFFTFCALFSVIRPDEYVHSDGFARIRKLVSRQFVSTIIIPQSPPGHSERGVPLIFIQQNSAIAYLSGTV